LICANSNEAQEITNQLTYGEASREKLDEVRQVTGFVREPGADPLFVEDDGHGGLRSTVIQIHVGEKEERDEAAWASVRAAINAIDHDEIDNPNAAQAGEPKTLPNPYNVVVSVMMLKEGWDVRNVKVIVPLRTCDSRTLTEQTLGRGLRRMHPPQLDEAGAVSTVREELYVMQHPSFSGIIEEIKDIVELRDQDEIDHLPEYLAVTPRADDQREAVAVRLTQFIGIRERQVPWTEHFVAPEVPRDERAPWIDDVDDLTVATQLYDGASGQETDGQTFILPAVPVWRDYDRLVETVYALPLLRDVQAAFSHKNEVKLRVKAHLERQAFKLPVGLPVDFGRAIAEGPEPARLVLYNLLRPEVVNRTLSLMKAAVAQAMKGSPVDRRVELSERSAADLGPYVARKQHVLEHCERSVFVNGAFDSGDELRFASLLDRCSDVLGWLYNHRQGVGHRIEYDYEGHTRHYYPDFIVRVGWGGHIHNVIVEVKGRKDLLDEYKEQVGVRYAATLSEHDSEPWHYLFVQEDPRTGRTDLDWWESLAKPTLGALFRHLEGLPADHPLTARALTRQGASRLVQRLALHNGGVSYGHLMEAAEAGEADRDQILIAAEQLATAVEPRYERVFVEVATGESLSEEEVSLRLSRREAGDESALTGVDVVYRALGGPTK
ncbi:MAG: hypothetical protein KC613_10485, partial [Myxococcales bacterium]|nr:hypothetical protein [Myxococcales bacterium]